MVSSLIFGFVLGATTMLRGLLLTVGWGLPPSGAWGTRWCLAEMDLGLCML